MLGFVNLLIFVKTKQVRPAPLVFFCVSIIFGLTSFLAPGTGLRVTTAGVSFNFFKVLAGSIGMTLYLMIEFLCTTPILLATLLYVVFLHAQRDKLEQLRTMLDRVRWYWILLFILAALTAVNFVVFTALGPNGLVDRLKNVYIYTLLFGWIVFVTSVFFELEERKYELRVPGFVTAVVAFLLFAFFLTGFKLELSGQNVSPAANQFQRVFSSIETGSVYTNAYLDVLSGRAAEFGRQNRAREQQLRNLSDSTISFPLYSFVPETIFVQDVNHPFGQPEWLTAYFCGAPRQLNYAATGPPVPPKKKF